MTVPPRAAAGAEKGHLFMPLAGRLQRVSFTAPRHRAGMNDVGGLDAATRCAWGQDADAGIPGSTTQFVRGGGGL